MTSSCGWLSARCQRRVSDPMASDFDSFNPKNGICDECESDSDTIIALSDGHMIRVCRQCYEKLPGGE
jgi:hypothetical protein